MMRLVLVTALLGLSTSNWMPALADDGPPPYSAVRFMTTWDEVRQYMFVAGVAQRMNIEALIEGAPPYAKWLGPCFEQTSMAQFVVATKNYLNARPELWNEPLAMLVGNAVVSLCSKIVPSPQ